MDIVAVLRYVFDHNQQVIAGLVVFILITAIFLFLRAIGQEQPRAAAAPAAASPLDIGAIETAFKKVMEAQARSAPASDNGTEASPTQTRAASSAAVAERDSKVQELAREIDRLTKELATKDTSVFGTVQASVDPEQLMLLQEKIDELQGKLSEYEIIEDDIADLSRYKEENSQLRSELEQLKKNTETRIDATPNLSTPPAPRQTVSAEVEPPQTFERMTPVAASLGASEPGDIVMKEFASSIQIQISPAEGGADANSVLNDHLDTEKMLAEVAGLSASAATNDEDALSESLDTDKLMSEVVSLEPAASASAPVPMAPIAAASQTMPQHGHVQTQVLEDDLLAEFKETNDGGQG